MGAVDVGTRPAEDAERIVTAEEDIVSDVELLGSRVLSIDADADVLDAARRRCGCRRR
jgi:hypothetical protein